MTGWVCSSPVGLIQAIVVEKGAASHLEEVNRFVADVRASGFVKASLERAQLAGVEVAPATAR